MPTENGRKSLGPLESAVASRLETLDRDEAVKRLWAKDPTLFKPDPKVHPAILHRLGWLEAPDKADPAALATFASELKAEGFKHALLLGMGGSSLAPEVLERTFKHAGGLELRVCDSTAPATVLAATQGFDLAKTVVLVCSKSGSTIEIVSLYAHFKLVVGDAKRFVAITDPGTTLENQAKEAGFRRFFSTPEDVGGRFSALTAFGLLPAALIGADVSALVASAKKMAQACRAPRAADNPGLVLGAVLAEAALRGRDKLTLLISPELAGLGSWIEQLVAESTGKEGRGVVPIDGETPGAPGVYGKDRVFVYLRLASGANSQLDACAEALKLAEQPVLRLDVPELTDLGGEFFRWEVATAVAGAVLGINPFDEPNVSESKEITRDLLQGFEKTGRLAEAAPVAEEEGLKLFADDQLKVGSRSVADWLEAHLARGRTGTDFAALLAFVRPTPAVEKELASMRLALRDRRRLATVVGFGPRFLHSTGQLFKGGTNCGLFLQITADDAADVPIPGAKYGFSTLKQAQAAGDFLALKRHQRRVLRVHLTGPVEDGVAKLARHVADIVSGARSRA